MNLKAQYVFIINSIIAILFGLGFMFIPDMLMTLIGFSNAADGPTAFRFFGITVFGASVLTFLVRNEGSSAAGRAIMISQVINFILINIFLIIFGDLTNLMLWFTIILHILLIVAYCYLLLQK
ncbi:MAG: hypothetical protein ACFFEY_20575 [Candidatus Thorarchaeota archaeon]